MTPIVYLWLEDLIALFRSKARGDIALVDCPHCLKSFAVGIKHDPQELPNWKRVKR